jgi:lycopene cyclase domain-containing protein
VTYTVAAALGVAAALALDLAVLRTRLVLGRVFWLSYPIVLAFQLLANAVLAGRGVVRYDPAAILGPRLAGAPVEDLAFGFALVLGTLAIWSWLGPRSERSLRSEYRGRGSERTFRGGPGQVGKHLSGSVRQFHTAQGTQGGLGEVGDALLGPGERTRVDNDLP